MNNVKETTITLQAFLSLFRAINTIDLERLANDDGSYMGELDDEHKGLAMFSPSLLADLASGYSLLWSQNDIDYDVVRWRYLEHMIDILNPE